MDHSDNELNSSSSEGRVGYPHSKGLPTTGKEHLSSTSDACSSRDPNSLLQGPKRCAPRRSRIRKSKGRTLSSLSALNLSSDDSSDTDFLPLTHEIAEFFKNPYRRWGKQKKKETRKKRVQVRRKGPRSVTKRKPQYSVPLEEKRRRLLDQGIQFPFTSFKYLPFRQYFTYEQHVLGGFLNHIKNLKYERTLKESLKNMKIDEDLENENVQMRKYSYLDEDGPLSPISDPGENLNEDEAEDEEVKVVENSTFILDYQVPSKEEWQIKKKGKKKIIPT